MSKPLARTAPPKRSSQHNSASKLERTDAVDPKTVRRIAVNYGQGTEPSAVELKEIKKAEKRLQKQLDKQLPALKSPTKRATLLVVSEDDLVMPPTLRQKQLPHKHALLFPRMHGAADGGPEDDTTVNTAASTASQAEDDGDAEPPADLDLAQELLGMPGGLTLDAETSAKYFGVEARFKFMQRVQWLAAQRNISCFEADEYADTLIFTDSLEATRQHGAALPFGAMRPLEEEEAGHGNGDGAAESKSIGSGSIAGELQLQRGGGSARSSFLSLGSHRGGSTADHMLRASRLRSGDDFRDEEEDMSPAHAAAQERTMLEELERITRGQQRAAEEEEAAQAVALEAEEAFQARLLQREREKDARLFEAATRKASASVDSVSTSTTVEESRSRVRDFIKYGPGNKENSWEHGYLQEYGDPVVPDTPRAAKDHSSMAAAVAEGKKHAEAAETSKVSSAAAAAANKKAGVGKPKKEADAPSKAPAGVTALTFEALSQATIALGAPESNAHVLTEERKRELGLQDPWGRNDLSARSQATKDSGISTTGMREHFLQKNINQEVLMSPRSQYISNCIMQGMNPRASLIVRKTMTKRLELQHYGMGDKMAAILAESIAELPHLQSINIADNGLTDDGMGPIILAAVQIKGLLELNLSKNEIGDVAADALAKYLKRADCPLQKLVMQTADVDDFEAEAFLSAVMENRSLTELDLSSNLIGGAENLNTVYPDLTTGSEALADLLRVEGIKLKTLKLVWNMIRLDGAVDFCSSLAVNETLTYLDLSYNSLAQDGGIMLGQAIEDNHSLETLIIANNAIDAIACFTICVGIISNLTLKKVVFDGNPIAEQGAQALMLVPMHAGGRVALSAAKCNITMKDPSCWFDFTSPCRSYDLNLANGFERAVAKVILMIIACHHSFIFELFDYTKPGGKPVPMLLKQAVSTERVQFFSKREKDIVTALNKIVDSAGDIKGAVRLFQEVDEDGSGEVDREELGELINSMGINITENRIDEIFALYDVDGGGSIGLSEFLSFLKTQKQESAHRIKDMTEIPIMVDSANPGKPNGQPLQWVPPREGVAKITVVDGFITKAIKRVMSPVDQANIQAVVENASGAAPSAGSKGSKGGKGGIAGFATGGGGGGGGGTGASGLLERGLVGTKLRLDEALACAVTMLSDGKENTKVLRMVLPQMEGHKDAQALVRALTNGDRTALMKLKREIGNALRPILGAPNGFYIIDLADEMDRFCMNRLLEISKTQANRRQQDHAFFDHTQIGDLSQKRNWSCFRNEFLNAESVTVDEHFASPLPRKGMLEFDFICTARANRDDVVLPDTRIIKVLVNSYLLEPEDALKALHRLKHYYDAGEHSLDCDGRTVYEQPTKRAHAIALAMDDFYNNRPLRRSQYAATLVKEASTKMSDGKIVDDLDDDDNPLNEDLGANNKDGEQLGLSCAMKSIHKSAGWNPLNKSKKRGKHVAASENESDEDEDQSSNGGSSDRSEDSGSDDVGSKKFSIKQRQKELEKINKELHWMCESCLASNVNESQHCEQCQKSNPNYVMGHNIDAEFDSNIVGTRKGSSSKLIVGDALKKSGRVEGEKKANNKGILDGEVVMGLHKDEKVVHDRREMDSDYESELENNDGEDKFESSSSSSSSDDENGADADIKQFMKLKIKEKEQVKKERAKAKREAARKLKEAARKLKEEERRKLAKIHGDLSGSDEDEKEEEEDEAAVAANAAVTSGTTGGLAKSVLAGLNAGDHAAPLDNSKELSEEEMQLLTGRVDEDGILRRAGGVTDTKIEAAKAGVALGNEEREDELVNKKKVHKTEMEIFAEKMRIMLESPTVHIGLKARRMIEWMEETFGRVWIVCRHLMLILQCFRGLGHKKQTKYFGTYRVDLLIALFHRVVDIHNFEIVLKCLSPFEAAAVYARLGWLHIFNPCKPEGGWEVDLTRPEERLVAKMLCELATVEPGDNWIEQYFQWQRDTEGMPGWELTTPWLTEEGMPCRGILMIYYFSGDGKGLKQCKPNVPFRKSLLKLVLIDEQDIVEEGFRDRPPPKPIGEPYMYNNSARWKQYLGAIVDLTRVR